MIQKNSSKNNKALLFERVKKRVKIDNEIKYKTKNTTN